MSNEFAWTQAPLNDWQTFCRDAPSPFNFDAILDRSQIPLPDWFLPFARGVVIPSPYYLSEVTGFDAKTFRQRGWRPLKGVDGSFRLARRRRFLVRRCGSFFSIESSCGKSLVHRFASTPVFGRTLEEAQYLAQLKDPPFGLHWVNWLPLDPKYTSNDRYKFMFSSKLAR